MLSIAFIPWISGAADAPRWALIALGALPSLWCSVEARAEHGLGIALYAWAVASLAWTIGIYDGIDALAKMAFLAGMFVVGGALPSLRPVYVGLALGFAVNSAIAVAQWRGFDLGIPQIHSPAGLFANKNYLAEAAALVLVALVASRLWWFVPAVLPAVLLPGSRGAVAGIAAAAVAYVWTRSRVAASALVAAGLIGAAAAYAMGYGGDSMAERLLIYKSTIAGMTWMGNGIGSFFTNFPSHAPDFPFVTDRPAHAHNDFLEMAYELGPASLLYLAIVALALCGPFGAEKLALIAFLMEGCFGFPLHCPVPAALAALAAGRLCHLRGPLCVRAALWRARIRFALGYLEYLSGAPRPS